MTQGTMITLGPAPERGVRRGVKPSGPYPFGVPAPQLNLEHVASVCPPHAVLEEIIGLLRPFNGRARDALCALLEGHSLASAAVAASYDPETLSRWRKAYPDFDIAVRACHAAGSSRYEGELHGRALAGKDDRGSMRALELVVKARNPDYRDKSQVQMGVVHVAADVLRSAGGWRELVEGNAHTSESELLT